MLDIVDRAGSDINEAIIFGDRGKDGIVMRHDLDRVYGPKRVCQFLLALGGPAKGRELAAEADQG